MGLKEAPYAMDTIQVRFSDLPNCEGVLKASLSTAAGKHIRRSIDGQPWKAAKNGATVGTIHKYAMSHGLTLTSLSEDRRGDYVLRYESSAGARLSAAENAYDKAQDAKHTHPVSLDGAGNPAYDVSAALRQSAPGRAPEPEHVEDWTTGFGNAASEDAVNKPMPWDGSGGARHTDMPPHTHLSGTGIPASIKTTPV